MVIFCRILGGILAFAGGGWLLSLLADVAGHQYAFSTLAGQIGMAMTLTFFGLLLIGLGEVCRNLAEIAANTRKPD